MNHKRLAVTKISLEELTSAYYQQTIYSLEEACSAESLSLVCGATSNDEMAAILLDEGGNLHTVLIREDYGSPLPMVWVNGQRMSHNAPALPEELNS